MPQASFTDEDLAHMYRQRCEWPCAGGVEWETQTARLALQVLADLRECEGDLEAHAKNQFLMLLRQALDAASLAQQVGRARRQEASEEVGMAPPYHSDGPPVDRSQEAPEDRIGAPPPLQRLRSVAGRRPTGPVAAWPSAEKEAESEPASPPAAAAAAAALCPGDRVRHTGLRGPWIVVARRV